MIYKDLLVRYCMFHIYTGESKGKTTASVGLTVRAIGARNKVLFASFFKPDGSSEHEVIEQLGATFMRYTYRGNFFKRYDKEEIAKAKEAFTTFFAEVKEAAEGHDMIVMDEVVYAIHMGLVDEKELVYFAKEHTDKELVMTGRDYPQALIDVADYVTEMKKIKHPFDQGAQPRKGVEF